MFFANIYRIAFLLFSFSVVIVLLFLMFFVNSMKKNFRICVTTIISIGILSVISYCFFQLSAAFNIESKFLPMLLETLSFICTSWLTMIMSIYCMEYTGYLKKYSKLIIRILSVWYILDSLSFMANFITGHMFVLSKVFAENGFYYWSNYFSIFYHIHLTFCYLLSLFNILLFLKAVVNVPFFYKRKYVIMLVVNELAIMSNFVCFLVKHPYDYSIVLYPLLAGFFAYSTAYSFPHKLLVKSLSDINETVSEALIYFDIYGNCIFANKSAEKLFPLKEVQPKKYRHINRVVNNKDVKRRIDAEAAEKYRRTWANRIGLEDEAFEIDIDTFIVDGKARHYAIDYHKEYYNSSVIGMCLKFVDKTEEIDSYRKEHYIARHDELTGILNSLGFYEAVEKLVAQKGTDGWMMICSDIKDFKFVNEIFGEKFGDQILCAQAEVLRQCAPMGAVYGRIADDHFALYMPKSEYSEKKMLDAIGQIQKLADGYVYKMHVFMGIYEPNGRSESPLVMVDKANMAISMISENYSEFVAHYDSALMEKVLDEKNLIHDFDVAMRAGQIGMFLQPIFDEENNCTGAEALCRWEHPLRGLMQPKEFLNVLERSGQVYQLDEYMWRMAAQKLVEWHQSGYYDKYISVNISVRDFYFIDIYKAFCRVIDCYDIPPSSIHIEITEDFMIADFDKTVQFVNKLKKAGFIVALDDFGNHYSSLNMLKDLNVDILKIDRELVNTSVHEKRNRIILQSIINMANLLDIKTVCEGVENKEIFEFLKQNGCQFFQGNFLGSPSLPAEFEKKFL